VVSGLASGIDTAAHTAALEAGGQTICVIGTPISETYPRENSELQEHIARNHLLVSQVPIIRYMRQSPKWNRLFFPERNATMSALTQATVIVEAGETSGSLIQGRAALDQGRKLFILESCFHLGLKWPERLQAAGAIRVSEYEEIRKHLGISGHSH
jgi:DNA processing protein